jgi:tetratricopeptide (TPR) repeat protein
MAATKTAHTAAQAQGSSRTAKAPAKVPIKAKTLAGQVVAAPDMARAAALEQYQAALRLMQEGDYEQAHAAFNTMLADSPPDVAERIRVYIAACLQQVSRGKTEFQSHEEQFDYAISLLNEGHYDDAREHLSDIVSSNQSADFAFYGLAVLASMTGDSNGCLEHLTEAIRLKSQNRLLARGDSDFEDMADDPRFTELLYPEI